MSLYDSKARREIYFIFQDSRAYPGWPLFKEGFRHVFAIERHGTGWTCVDPNTADLYCWPVECEMDAPLIENYAANNPSNTILKILVQPREPNARARPGWMTCVSIMKYMLGVHWPLIQTPYQLYCKLTNGNFPRLEVTPWAARLHPHQ